jgi:hypothetical protein
LVKIWATSTAFEIALPRAFTVTTEVPFWRRVRQART